MKGLQTTLPNGELVRLLEPLVYIHYIYLNIKHFLKYSVSTHYRKPVNIFVITPAHTYTGTLTQRHVK